MFSKNKMSQSTPSGYDSSDDRYGAALCLDEEGCKNLCLKTPGCKGFDMHISLDRCYLSELANCEVSEASDSYDLYQKIWP